MKSDIEQSYIADIISSRYPTSDLPEGIVEVGELTREPAQFSATATKQDGGVGFVQGAAPAPMSSSSTAPTTGRVFPEDTASIQNIPRTQLEEMMGNIGSAIQTGAEYLDFAVIGLPDVGTLSLKDLTVGDLGKVMEAMSYGFAPTTGEGQTLRPTPEALDLLNAIPAFQAANKAIKYGVKGLKAGAEALAPAAADVIESGLRKTGMITDIVPDGKSVIKPEDIKLIEETKSDWVFELPNGTRKNVDKFEYLSDVAAMGQYAPSKEQMILSAKKDVAQMVYEQANKQAPKSDIGFYSAVENAAINVQRKSGTGQSFLNDIMKGENVKAEEIKWIGLDDFLKSKKNVTKQEVQDYIANNKVDVQEVKSTVIRPLLDNGARPVMEGDKGAFLPKFGQYVLEGGENYRELLLTMPAKQLTEEEARKILGAAPDAKLSAADISYASRKNVNEFKSSHFPQQENILAHLRVNDRVDADGKKMLLIEEVQSDWHQAGRDSGYLNKDYQKIRQEFADYSNDLADKYNLNPSQNLAMYATIKGIKPEEIAKYEELQKAFIKTEVGVADAPFKDTWYQLALKRALQYASENGYERVGLTTGKQQADRFSLSNEVNTLAWRDAGGGVKRAVSLDMVNGENITLSVDNTGKVMGGNFEGKSLSSVIGKDLSNKIMSKDTGNLAGEGLTIGGEGMKKYYDEIYPKFLEKYGKKWNAKMGETGITTNRPIVNGVPSMYPDKETVRYIDITPEMKAGVQKGQPLFAAAPIGAATGAATMQDERKK